MGGKNKKNKGRQSTVVVTAATNDPEQLKVSSNSTHAAQNMGNEEYQRGNIESAITLYTKAIELGQSEIYFSNRKISHANFQALKPTSLSGSTRPLSPTATRL